MNDDLASITQRASSFAREHIASRPGLSSTAEFPIDLWKAMGEEGLLGIAVPQQYGGLGLGYPEIQAAGRALTRSGCCLGMTLAWLMQQITARFFLGGFGTPDQLGAYLPDTASGRLTTCIAISEPGKGGHPKYIATSAEREGSSVRISGEKTYLTNGPIAGLYIVLAVSGREGDRKRFSAYLVPRETPGLTLSEPLDFGFFRPCPHGGIMLKDCLIPAESLLGDEGSAYERMALPFREVEDVMMTGPLLGAQEARLQEMVRSLGPAAADDVALKLGGMEISLAALDLIAQKCAQRLKREGARAELTPLILSFRRLYRQAHTELEEVITATGINMPDAYRTLTQDLAQAVKFAERVSALKQMKIGRKLLNPS